MFSPILGATEVVALSSSEIAAEFRKFDVDFAERPELVSTLILERGINFSAMPPQIRERLEKAKDRLSFLKFVSPRETQPKTPFTMEYLITNDKLEFLAKYFSQIQTLTFRGCLFETNLKALGNWKELTELDFSHSMGFTSPNLSAAIKSLALKKLNVSYTGLDDNIINLQRSCSFLTELNIEGCTKITKTAAMALLNTAKSLKIVNMKGCINISQEVLCHWVKWHPGVAVTLPSGTLIKSEPQAGAGSHDLSQRDLSQRAFSPLPVPESFWANVELVNADSKMSDSKSDLSQTLAGLRITSLTFMTKAMQNVETLVIRDCVVEGAALEKLSELKKLKSLTIEHSEGGYDPISLLTKCESLSSLEIVNVETTNSVISAVLFGCKNLQRLTIKNCKEIKKGRIQVYLPFSLTVVEQEKLLTKVDIS